ncbi:hypothetical protein FB474_0592 [Oryzihumus leptocrescens]|uniref:Uncharacterized protein n=2 Tax=Oryzihumus leptocrescens TaxID=297536 RepID=A0A542ZFX5_9MICO|nr:hypothetical protein FB474_0592 [Oryzihumus leptocrescens]
MEIPGEVAGEPVVVFLLSREQRVRARRFLLAEPVGTLSMANGQRVHAEHRTKPYRKIPLSWTDGMDGRAADGTEYFQTIDSSSFNDVLDNPHSYFVILNSLAAKIHNTGWVKVSNRMGVDGAEQDPITSFAVRTAFADRIGPREVALDETVSVAIGMREGELVHIESIDPKVGTLRRRAFSFRHTIVRVVGATTMDMEKPVVRLPAGVLDILGVASGSRVIVEALSRENDQIRRVSARVLEEREQRQPRLGGVFDVLDMTGSVDLPAIAMDLSMRNRLGIHRGDPVYVRPEFATVFFEEFATVSFALLAAAVGAYAASAQLLAGVLVAVYVGLSGIGMWRKFR